MTDSDLKTLAEERLEQEQKEKPKEPQKESGGMSMKTRILLGIIGLIIIVLIVAYLTINVATSPVSDSASFPYTTTYGVSFPEGETITIGTSRILVLSYENEIFADIDGEREKLLVGDEREVLPRHARITVLGIPLMETDFQIMMKYKGVRENRAYFDLTVKTEKQVPEFLISRLLPREIDARPI